MIIRFDEMNLEMPPCRWKTHNASDICEVTVEKVDLNELKF